MDSIVSQHRFTRYRDSLQAAPPQRRSHILNACAVLAPSQRVANARDGPTTGPTSNSPQPAGSLATDSRHNLTPLPAAHAKPIARAQIPTRSPHASPGDRPQLLPKMNSQNPLIATAEFSLPHLRYCNTRSQQKQENQHPFFLLSNAWPTNACIAINSRTFPKPTLAFYSRICHDVSSRPDSPTLRSAQNEPDPEDRQS